LDSPAVPQRTCLHYLWDLEGDQWRDFVDDRWTGCRPFLSERLTRLDAFLSDGQIT
jgi:hypothetical protein